MGETLPGNPDLQPPEGQAGPGEEGAPPPASPEPPIEDGQGETGEGAAQADAADAQWSEERRLGYSEGTRKYVEELRERDRVIDRLQIEREVERRQVAPPAEEQFPEEVQRELFTKAQRASPDFKSLMQTVSGLQATVSESVIDNSLARLERDHGKRPFHQDVAEKVRTALRGSPDLKPGTVEAAYHHFAAPKVEELLLKTESELRALRKGRKKAMSRDGYSTPGGHAAGGEALKSVSDMSDDELANAYARALMEKTGA